MIYYQVQRPGPIKLNDPLPVARRSDLPLVDHIGSFASKAKWDDRGTIRINRSRSPRFAADSYFGEKPFLNQESNPLPNPVNDPNRTFNREPAHVFPGLKKPLDQRYIEDKKALFKSIIQGK